MTAAPRELALVLHAHLPWVREPEADEAIEERWLFDALIECYLPLLGVLDGLARDQVPGALALSLSPPLLRMLRDAALHKRFERHFTKREALVDGLFGRVDPVFRPALAHHAAALAEARGQWSRCDGDLSEGFAAHRRAGRVSLWTCADPHPLLPLWMEHGWFVDGALARAIALHREVFGCAPDGLWLPECGYAPGLDAALAACGITVTVLETHGLLHGAPRPSRGVGALVRSPAGVRFAGRDPHAATAVWSRGEGYPGEAVYQDFGSDLGHGPQPGYTARDGSALRTGVRVFAVTDRRGGAKAPWEPAAARAQARRHAEDFVRARAAAVDGVHARISIAPYDAELFGHWWAEGPWFLDGVLRVSAARGDVRCVALDASEAARDPSPEVCAPAASTWGRGGHLAAWLDGPAAYMARALDAMARALPREPAVNAPGALAELVAASASDWPFLLNGGGAPHYARRRFDAHHDAFWRALRRELALCPLKAREDPHPPTDPGDPRP